MLDYILDYAMALVLVPVYILGMDVVGSNSDDMDCTLLANTMDRIAMDYNTNYCSTMCYSTKGYMLHSNYRVLTKAMLLHLLMQYMVCSHLL